MKSTVYAVVAVVMVLLISACTPPSHMLVRENVPPDLRAIRPESGKAALVVARTTIFGGAVEFDTYLDRKMIGVTQRKGYFVKTDVTPGMHYVITKAENFEPIRILFEQERVYYLQQIPRMGVWRARVSVAPVTPEELMTTMDEDCKLMEYNANDPGDDLSEEDYTQAVADYERELKEGRHRDRLEYRGVEVKE